MWYINMQWPWKTRGEMIASFGTNLVCAEIGVEYGDFSQEIIKNDPKELVLVDVWEKQTGTYERDTSNLNNFEALYQHVVDLFGQDKRVKIIKDFSSEAVKMFPDEHFDFVYIDANHTWKGITNDIHDWWPKVKIGGYLCGHDYIHKNVYLWNGGKYEVSWVEVRPVVDAWAEVKAVELLLTWEDGPAHSWAIKRDH